MDEIQNDPRFEHVTKDPRFRQMPRKQRKVKVDKRFQSMFSDKRFKLKYSVDKRGRPIDTSTDENLKKYYDLQSESSDDDESDNSDDDDNVEKDYEKRVCKKEDSGVEEDSVKSDASDDSDEEKLKSVSKKLTKKQKKIATKQVNKVTSSKPKQKSAGKQRKDIDKEESQHSDEENGDTSSDDQTKKLKKKITKSELTESTDGEEDNTQVEACTSDQKSQKAKQKKTGKKSKKDLIDMATAPDLARGAVLMESSSEDEDFFDELDDEFDHGWGELDKDVPETEDLSSRLAICNMDWDRIKAHDLFLLFNSFVPPGGILHSIKIYPSEYGLKRMAEEEKCGPVELTKEVEDPEAQEESVDGSRYHREKLRKYQLNRLKYYYAVAEFDSVKTASHVYEECDGREFESSASKLDLRYIPDDMKFEETPKSECTSIAATSYKPQNFFTSALCQSKVDLTWDETDRDRISVTMNKFQKADINEDDFKAFLASDSEGEVDYGDLVAASDESDSEESDEEKQIDKYKQLLQSLDDSKQASKNKDMDMEITWEPGLKETTKDLVKKKKKESGQSPWEQYLDKKKLKKKQLKEQRKSAAEKRELESEAHAAEHGEAFSDDELPPGVDLSDPYFSEELNGCDKVKKKGHKKKKKGKVLSEEELAKQKQEEAELALLTMEENEEGKHHFNLDDLVKERKKKKKKHKKPDTGEVKDDFEIKVDDPRFSAMYNSHLFNIDPSAPEFKRTKGIEAIIEEKLKRRKHSVDNKSAVDDSEDVTAKRRKHSNGLGLENSRTESETATAAKDVSLTSLVKSVKAKTQQFYTKNKFR